MSEHFPGETGHPLDEGNPEAIVDPYRGARIYETTINLDFIGSPYSDEIIKGKDGEPDRLHPKRILHLTAHNTATGDELSRYWGADIARSMGELHSIGQLDKTIRDVGMVTSYDTDTNQIIAFFFSKQARAQGLEAQMTPAQISETEALRIAMASQIEVSIPSNPKATQEMPALPKPFAQLADTGRLLVLDMPEFDDLILSDNPREFAHKVFTTVVNHPALLQLDSLARHDMKNYINAIRIKLSNIHKVVTDQRSPGIYRNSKRELVDILSTMRDIIATTEIIHHFEAIDDLQKQEADHITQSLIQERYNVIANSVQFESRTLAETLNRINLETILSRTDTGVPVQLEQFGVAELGHFITDHRLLARVMQNIISNAVTHGKPRNITLSAYVPTPIGAPIITSENGVVESPIEYPRHIVITIENDGISLPEGVPIHDLFKKSTKGSHSQGDGLGLYICKRLIRPLHGHISASRLVKVETIFDEESETHKEVVVPAGTKFEIRLPATITL
jgi:signal transduction histidine kinase